MPWEVMSPSEQEKDTRAPHLQRQIGRRGKLGVPEGMCLRGKVIMPTPKTVQERVALANHVQVPLIMTNMATNASGCGSPRLSHTSILIRLILISCQTGHLLIPKQSYLLPEMEWWSPGTLRLWLTTVIHEDSSWSYAGPPEAEQTTPWLC